jgi:Tol biopolymer transport system component
LIAFTSARDGDYDIYIMNVDGSDLRQLTNDPGTEGYAARSPDGAKIAFYAYDDLTTWSIYVMDADGSNRQRLTNREGVWDSAPVWSPDGTQIVFGREQDDNGEIWVMNADGSNQKKLEDVSGGGPRWSPDGTQIIFASETIGDSEIFVINADGSDQRQLTDNDAEDWWPSWSPDGTQIAFMSGSGSNYEIYVMNVEGALQGTDGSNQQRLTNNHAENYRPSWSPDGEKIIFTSNQDGDFEIIVMNADGSNQQQITNNSEHDIQPAWWRLTQTTESPTVESNANLQPDGTGTVSDADGNVYPIVRIGDQWWMATNLNVTFDSDGESITGYCYDCVEENCGIYGRLYTWDTTMNGSTAEGAPGICPTG